MEEAIYEECHYCKGRGTVTGKGADGLAADYLCEWCDGYGVRAPDYGPLTPTFEDLIEVTSTPN